MDNSRSKTASKVLLVALFLAWMLPGLVGRDPWKADEPYTFGIASHMLQTGEWIVPNVAGTPFLEKPPIYFISAALAGKAGSPFLELHDAVRLINLFWMALTLLFLALAVKEISGGEAAENAPVLLISCVVLQVTAHKMITDVALLSGLAVGLYGLAASRRRPGWGGFWTGTGAGIGFLAKGLLAPGILGLIALFLPLLFVEWRSRAYGRALSVACLSSLPWLTIWPVLLYLRSADYFLELFWYQNFGRFFGFARVQGTHTHWRYLLDLPWQGLPVLPLAAWALWKERTEWRRSGIYQLPLVAFLVMMGVLSAAASNRNLYALPMILPLTMIAAVSANHLSERARSLITRAAVVLFGIAGIALWLAMLGFLTGIGAVTKLLPSNTLHYGPLDPRLLLSALAITLFWLIVAARTLRRDGPILLSWAAGVVLVWGLAMTLWLPWLEASASYRGIFSSLQNDLPKDRRCVASYGMGESERAMIEYYAGIQVRPIDWGGKARCDLLVVARDRAFLDTSLQPAWTVIWEGRRPQDRPKEHYTLFRTASPKEPPPLLSEAMIHLKGP